MPSAPPSFKPFEALAEAIRFWWLVVVCIIIGGFVGWAINLAQAPLYEAQSSISVTLDFTRTGALDDAEEDWAIGVVGDMIHSTFMLDKTAKRAAAEGITITPANHKQVFFSERRDNLWILRVRHPNPEIAARIANFWVDAAHESLIEAKRHALAADKLNRYLDSLTSCLEKTIVTEPVHAQCSLTNLPVLQQELKTTSDLLHQETLASQNISPALTFSLSEKASVPGRPILFGQNTAVLAGGVSGLLIAALIMQSGIPAQLLRKKS